MDLTEKTQSLWLQQFKKNLIFEHWDIIPHQCHLILVNSVNIFLLIYSFLFIMKIKASFKYSFL